MIGPLVPLDDVPGWLRPLVGNSSGLDSSAFTRLRPPPGAAARPAAVLVLFGDDSPASAGPDVLLQRRADTLDSHAGQVSFPGGGAEDGDDGPVATALREAEEETGVDPAGVEPLALLPDLYVPVSNFAVTPVLAHWHRTSPVHAVDPGETAVVARVPIAELVDPRNRFQVRIPGRDWTGPAFAAGGLFVWGFTAGLLAVLLRLGGWEREWDSQDVRDLDVALSEHEERARAVGRRGE